LTLANCQTKQVLLSSINLRINFQWTKKKDSYSKFILIFFFCLFDCVFNLLDWILLSHMIEFDSMLINTNLFFTLLIYFTHFIDIFIDIFFFIQFTILFWDFDVLLTDIVFDVLMSAYFLANGRFRENPTDGFQFLYEYFLTETVWMSYFIFDQLWLSVWWSPFVSQLYVSGLSNIWQYQSHLSKPGLIHFIDLMPL
jgi:hypothetical protein